MVLAPTAKAYHEAIRCCRQGGTVVALSFPCDTTIPLDIHYLILNGITLRGSLIGNRVEVMQAMDFAARGLVTCHVSVQPNLFECTNADCFERMKCKLQHNEIVGRVVFDLSAETQPYVS